jgi:hypothetical protein
VDDRTTVRRLEFVPVEPPVPAPAAKTRRTSRGHGQVEANAATPPQQPPALAETRWSLWGDPEA